MTELSIQASLHRRGHWVLVPLTVGPTHLIYMVLDAGSPYSAISEGVRDSLLAATLLPNGEGRAFHLRNPRIQGQTVPDMAVILSHRVTQVGAEGALGLDFIRQFTDVRFHVPSLLLTLTGP